MTDPGQENAGDYGYDLAHEERGRPRPPEERHAPEQPPQRGSTSQSSGDYGYDEAHSF